MRGTGRLFLWRGRLRGGQRLVRILFCRLRPIRAQRLMSLAIGRSGQHSRARLLCLIALIGLPLPGGATEIRGSGYIKYFATAIDPPVVNGKDGPTEGASLSRARLRLLLERRPISVELAYELASRIEPAGSGALGGIGVALAQSLPRPSPLTYRAVDLRRRLYPSPGDAVSSFSLRQNLDRLLVTWSAAAFDVYAGRQPIAFGSARIVNPTDVLAPFTYEELDKEERIGVDSLRLRFPLGDLSELDAGYVFGDDLKWSRSAAFVRSRLYVSTTDVSPLILFFRRHLLIGLDLARAIRGAGWWLETGYVFADDDAYASDAGEGDYLRLSTGLDYSLSPALYGLLEYHYSDAGSGSSGGYLQRGGRTPFVDGGVYLLGRHYLAPAATWQVTPLLVVTGQGLVNLQDRSSLVGPRLEYSFADEVFLELGAFVGIGEGLVSVKDTPEADLYARSEFGLYPNTFFGSLRLYF